MKNRGIRILSVLLCSLMIIGCVGGLNASAESPDYHQGTPKMGIDVSYYQGDIDWQKVKSQVDFVIIRVGYTGYGNLSINLDTRFDEYVKGAKAVGIPIGVYYYGCATSVDMAVKEAKFVLEQIGRYPATFSYPIIYDIETSPTNNSQAYKIATQTSKAFCDTIRAGGYYPMVYSYTSYFNPYITTATISENDFWQAHYYSSYSGLTLSQLADKAPNRPSIQGNHDSNISIWQCTDGAKVSGISKGVDANICYFDYDSFIRSEGYNGFDGYDADDRVAICADESVNIRDGASTAFNVIGTAANGDKFSVKGFYNKDWLEIEYNGKPAYVYADYFSIIDKEEAEEDSGEYIIKEYVICTGSVVNIRSQANTKCEILGQAINGDEFLFVDDLGEWLKIEYNGEEAYIYAAYTTRKLVKEPVENSGDSDDIPNAENPKDNESTGGEEPDTEGEENRENTTNGEQDNATEGENPIPAPPKKLNLFQKIGGAFASFFASIGRFFRNLFG